MKKRAVRNAAFFFNALTTLYRRCISLESCCKSSFIGLSGNFLKIIALITMTIDHAGLELFDNMLIMRIIGRISFPIFAYMIAEGCTYTRNRRKHLMTIVSLALIYQVVYFVAMGSLYQGIFVTFFIVSRFDILN